MRVIRKYLLMITAVCIKKPLQELVDVLCLLKLRLGVISEVVEKLKWNVPGDCENPHQPTDFIS